MGGSWWVFFARERKKFWRFFFPEGKEAAGFQRRELDLQLLGLVVVIVTFIMATN